ncbi:MAG: hypothetical protein ABS69_11585 [Nitrosomonadales bacterium SCN 54-20]|nr:MAG: hypothetical protein ABS69_11585 [Nitrosomonadales bacterium SCN 54-20]
MTKQSAEIVTLQAPTTNKFLEAQDMLCETTYMVEFLRGTISSGIDSGGGFELSNIEACGFANVLQTLIERIEKANSLLDEHAAEQQKAGTR